MKRFLSFLMIALFSVAMFAAAPEPVKSTFTKKTVPAENKVTDLEGEVTWNIATTVGAGEPTIAVGSKNSLECLKFGSSKSIYFSKVEFSTDYFKDYNVTGVKVNVVNNGKKTSTLTAKQGEVTIGTESKEFGADAWVVMEATGKKGAGGTLTVTYEVDQASYYNYIEVTYEEEASSVKTIYCRCEQGWWTADGAAVGAHYWKDGGEGTTWPGVRMTAVDGEEGLWKIDLDLAKYEKVIFTRMNPSDEGSQDWGAKSGDQTIPTDDKNLFTITSSSAVWGDPGVEGIWSKYVAPEPVKDVTVYLLNSLEWEAPTAYVFSGAGSEGEWPGAAMTKTAEKANGFDIYSYTFKSNFSSIIFNDGKKENAVQTIDLEWDEAKPYFVLGDKNGEGKYTGTWYAKASDIPAPLPDAVPLEGDIWKVTDKTPTVAGSHYIDEALLKMDGVYATTLKANTRTIAGEEFKRAIQVRTDGYPTEANKVGAEKSGSTSLVITAKEDVDVTFYYNRQVVGDGGTENDNKDLIVFDQAAITTPLTGTFAIDQILEGNSYLNATKKVTLKKGHVYTVTASGTTLQLHGIKLEEHVIEKREIVLVPGDVKTADPSMFIYAWTAGKESYSAKMEIKEVGEDTLYTVQVPEELDSLIFVRAASGVSSWSALVWEGDSKNVWNKSEDQKIGCDTATFAGWAESMFKLSWCAEEEEPGELPVVALVGEMNKWNASADLFVPAADEKTASLTIKVEEVRTDSFKIVVGDKWLSAFGGADASYVVKRGWPKAEGVNREENVKNMVIIFDEIGDYTFTWTYASNLLEVTYPDKTIEPEAQYFLQNNWEGKEWAWKQATRQDDGTYKLENVVFGGNGVDYNTAAENNDNKIWIGIDAIQVADGKTIGALDTVTFVLDPAKNILYATILGKYQKPEVPEVTLYFVNVAGWSSVNAYVWGGAGATAWPGNAMIKTDKTACAKDVYSITFASENDSIIFNGDGGQTTNEVAKWDDAKPYFYDNAWYSSLDEINCPEPPADRVFTVVGEAKLVGKDWTAGLNEKANEMVKQTDGTYKLVKTDVLLGANKYYCKVAVNHSWNEAYPANNYEVNIAEDGYYTLTFTFNDDTHVFEVNAEKTGSAVVVKEYMIVGEAFVANGLSWDNSAEVNKMTTTDNGATYKLVVANASLRVRDYEYKVVEFETWTTHYPATGSANAKFTVTEKAAYTITYTYTVATSECVVSLDKTGAYVPRLEDGYYLVGNFDGVNMWNVDDITANQKLTINTGAEAEEYAITMTLKAGDEFKAVYVEDDEIKSYYPAEGDNYKVTDDQAGEKTIYFRPEGNSEWQGPLYVGDVATGLDALMSNENAVKVMLNGQIYILRGGKTYTIQGQLVK